jgi:WhiB family transcriptional regulator, redox-sensing transcriptional regulator
MVKAETRRRGIYQGVLDDWWLSAACRSTDPELFFPISAAGPALDDTAKAKAVCTKCRVRDECLSFATKTHQVYGIWGGLTVEERRQRQLA